jgi:pyruvate,water dikinase
MASVWSDRAVSYRERFGIQDDDAHLAVIIMEMIDADFGGVTFTADPTTGNRSKVLISARVGGADHVVAGTAPTEIWSVNADGLFPKPEQSIWHKGPWAPKRALLPDQARNLATLALQIARALSHDDLHQDIEWVIRDRVVYVLQARPITTVDDQWKVSKHQVDALWSNANLKDSSPHVQSPLGGDFLRVFVRHILLAPFRAAGYRPIKDAPVARLIAGRPHMNMAAMQWAYQDALGISPRELNQGIGGYQEEVDVSLIAQSEPLRRFLRRGRLLLAALIAWLVFALGKKQIIRRMDKVSDCTTDDINPVDLKQKLEKLEGYLTGTGTIFQLLNTLAGAGYSLLRAEVARLPGRDPDIWARRLIAGTGGVDSAIYSDLLVRLANAVRRFAPNASGASEISSVIEKLASSKADSEFSALFSKLLKEHGHRGVYEMEIANPRWSEDPSYLVKSIMLLVRDGIPDVREPTAPYYAAKAELRAEFSGVSHIRFLAIIGFARHSARFRENSKSLVVRGILSLRRLLGACGHGLHRAGLLATPADVYWCSWWDVSSWLDERSVMDFEPLVAHRKTALPILSAQKHGDLSRDGKSTVPCAVATGAHSANTVTGIGISPGCGSGIARRINHPDECERFQTGDVLVAPTSDPAWMPMFFRASAVVLEMGGILSHGAILARELGIPAVANIGKSAFYIADGAHITVDGDQGRVHIESNNSTIPIKSRIYQ